MYDIYPGIENSILRLQSLVALMISVEPDTSLRC